MKLTLKGIRKSFGAGNVLDGVDFEISGGEICALLGENGAGKSTLMNIVGGIVKADGGEILIDGEKVSFAAPADSLKRGIAFIHQELDLVNELTVYENLFLHDFPKKGIFLDEKKMIAETQTVLDRLGIGISPSATVSSLPASCRQTVEIARALLADASLIIMDEPTASLTENEIGRIFSIMSSLRDNGIALIFISHKLDEVMRICDRYTVLRNGRAVRSGFVRETTAKELASLMVGHDVDSEKDFTPTRCGEELFRLESLSDPRSFHQISFSLRKNEILGVTGLPGDGRRELFTSVFGLRGGKYTGKILLEGKEIHPASPEEALSLGISYLPESRKENAVLPDLSILDNGTVSALSSFRRFGFLDKTGQKAAFAGMADRLHIKLSDEEKPITALSGGNQQKTILARWLLTSPKVLILDNPTQGVDVGAKEEIYSIIRSLASSGIGIIVLSPEGKEIMRLCDRCLVFRHGEIAAELKKDEMDEKKMMILATGAAKGVEEIG